MPAELLAVHCICGARVEATPSPSGTVPCRACGREVVLDPRAAAAASPVDPASDTGPLARSSEEAARESAASLSHSLLGPGFAPGPVPSRIDRYRVLGKLGQGGMGVVYRGHDDALDRAVAIKVIPTAAAHDPEGARRLLREARATAAVEHENVVRVYAAGENEEGLPYLVMELVAGGDLRELLERDGPLPWRRAVDLMEQAARGLSAAQTRGLVHRDVKPANLLLDTRDGETVLKVADFGLAKARAAEASLTASGVIAGTPLYVAPEVAREGGGDLRADMYSLGATFFHALAGRPPFTGKTPAAVIVSHLTEPAPDLGRLRRDVPEGLALLIAKLLAKAPEDRYAGWSDLVAELGRVRDGRPVLAEPPPPPRALPPLASTKRDGRGEPREIPEPSPEYKAWWNREMRRRAWAAPERSLFLAYLLWLPPFGLLGLHRFYLARFSTGVLFLPTAGIFLLGWLHDLFAMPRLVRERRPPPAALALEDGEAIASAYLLWFFFGALGLHRFYAGRFLSGMLYLFTFGFFLVGWFVDLFLTAGIVMDARRQRN